MKTTLQKKQILVLTPIYPSDDIPKGWTPVVHYFTREWVKQGYEVHVINYVANFPRPVYWLTSFFKNRLASKVGYTIRTSALEDKFYMLEGVNVLRIALKKSKPHARYSPKQIGVAIQKTFSYLTDKKVSPDAIIAHWTNPSLELMYYLKQQFHVPTCYVAHGSGHFKNFGDDAIKFWQSVDVVGFRSDYIKRDFETAKEYIKRSFYCYSGIPSSYCANVKNRSWEQTNRIAYVGTLIKRKFPTALIPAACKVFGKQFYIRYAGEGSESSSIERSAKSLGVQERVKLLGRIARDEVVKVMDESDLFIMVSEGETFGLVYLEAMARGCITIASRREGFDGIIKHGFNGFLCEAGDIEELSVILETVKKMSCQERKQISENAMQTAQELTDEKVARHYIKNVLTIPSKTKYATYHS